MEQKKFVSKRYYKYFAMSVKSLKELWWPLKASMRGYYYFYHCYYYYYYYCCCYYYYYYYDDDDDDDLCVAFQFELVSVLKNVDFMI